MYIAVIFFYPLLFVKDRPQEKKAPTTSEIMLYTEEISAAMEVVSHERKGTTKSGTEFSVAIYRPTNKIVPADRVSYTKEQEAVLHEMIEAQREIAASGDKPYGIIRSIRKFLNRT
ncbi:hypothetical protein [Brevibacillus brevis]|uniref:Uncharacterized protein n=1 Tax=Brevibacillus brevis TaxID=1393 RepID=A0ABY9T425_BREBE|nr:hypothetical protein [Brevibacillus brevis]WNC14658.1 hypothetical protein RGB73_29025 [Brevibacillus brevis]